MIWRYLKRVSASKTAVASVPPSRRHSRGSWISESTTLVCTGSAVQRHSNNPPTSKNQRSGSKAARAPARTELRICRYKRANSTVETEAGSRPRHERRRSLVVAGSQYSPYSILWSTCTTIDVADSLLSCSLTPGRVPSSCCS